MTTTKQSTWGATLRTTILMAGLSGLLVVIGALVGGPSTAALFLGIALLWFKAIATKRENRRRAQRRKAQKSAV